MLNRLTKLIPIQYTTLDPSIKGRSLGVLIQIDELKALIIDLGL